MPRRSRIDAPGALHLRSKIVAGLKFLDKYAYSGHSVVMGRKKNDWQDTDYVLKLFNTRLSLARRQYRGYVSKPINKPW